MFNVEWATDDNVNNAGNSAGVAWAKDNRFILPKNQAPSWGQAKSPLNILPTLPAKKTDYAK
ncbi:MAG: hypothetical protein D3922_15935 [Candidatus Electrothrix sp. AR1]|nr:hypothetical protein [Candidatus Electrothrix sp. AR1]